YFSRILSLNLKEKLGYEAKTSISIPEPPIPESSSTVIVNPNDTPIDFKKYTGEPNVDYAECFTYKLVTSPTSSTYMITGVKPEYKSIKEVILPSVFDGKNVTAIAKDAFYGCTELERIHIGVTFKELSESTFNGCISLQGIYIYQTEGNRIIPPATGLMDGCSNKVKIYIPEGANYQTGYIWSNYESWFESFVLGGENEN
ncbi:MAG: hypothetical protein E7382_03895, partial [Clostridiales bacterium]|nr:hypothetical protein [Clostridiales bacterium]